jgi:nucleoside-diphosphate-sugar epimerase
MRVLVAGATGSIGRQLVPQLIAAGHQVSATTRSPAKIDGLSDLGADPLLLDGLDEAAVREAVARTEPDVIVHEMTAIPARINLRKFDETFAATSRLRTIGVDHLLAAADANGVGRFIAQSYAGWSNSRSGGPVKTEQDPLEPPASQREAFDAICYLEHAVTSARLEGLVLRYGNLYGPGSSDEFVRMLKKRQVPIIGSGAGVWSWLHVADAAAATVAAVSGGPPGIYNVVDDEPAPVAQWLPAMAAAVAAKPPMRVPVLIGRLAAGEVGTSAMTQVHGYSNAKAKAELGWQPIWPTWRDGFVQGLTQAYPTSQATQTADAVGS